MRAALRLGSAWGLLMVLAAFCAAPTWGQAPDQEGFTRHLLKLNTEFAELLTFDADGDGLSDLVVIEADRGHGRDTPHTLRVFRQHRQGFAPLAASVTELPRGVMLAGIGIFRNPNDPSREKGQPGLVLLLPGEVRVWPWRGDHFDSGAALVLPVESIFPVAGQELQQGLDWIQDLDEDGISEILVPGFERLTVLRQDTGGALKVHAILGIPSHTDLRHFIRRSVLSFGMPHIALADVDGKGWLDVVVYLNGQLRVFLLDDSLPVGGLGASPGTVRPAAVEMDFQPPRPFDPKEPRDPPLLFVAAKDLNGDGAFDLVFSKSSASNSEIDSRTTVMVHFGRKPGSEEGKGGQRESGQPIAFSDKPDQVFPSAGLTLPFLMDGNNDRRTDLVMVRVEIGFWNVIKALITRTVNAEAAYFPMTLDGRYAKEPQTEETYAVTFSLSRFGRQPIAAFGDLNGDRLPDLLLSVGTDRIGIHWGRKQGMWNGDYDSELKDFMPLHRRRVRIIDLNNDRRDDLIFLYNRDDIRTMPTVGQSVVIQLSRFGKEPPEGNKEGGKDSMAQAPARKIPGRKRDDS